MSTTLSEASSPPRGGGGNRLRRIWRGVFVAVTMALVLLACVSLLEWGLRRFYFRPWAVSNLIGNPDHRMTRQYNADVNSDGIRSAVNADDYREDTFNILFLGDSFTYGWKVPSEESFPAQLEQQAHKAGFASVRCVNFGWGSSSPLLSDRLLRTKGRPYKPDLVVLTLDMTDIYDDQLYRSMIEGHKLFRWGRFLPATTQFVSRVNKWVFRSERFAQSAFDVPLRQFFIVEQPLEDTRLYFDRTLANIDSIHAFCSDVLHVPFVLFVMPRHFQFDSRLSPHNWERNQYPLAGPNLLEPFRYFEEASQHTPFPVIALLKDFRQSTVYPMTFDDDPHLNAAGNTFAAATVLRHLSELNLLSQRDEPEGLSASVPRAR